MALGFGSNKTKILSAAEKFVQQGKLPNAIAEYEKVLKQDPKDLTVLNTIGDLYARIGRAEQAAEYFRKVGDAYSSDRSEEHTSELQSRQYLVCRLLLEKKTCH